jgi:hypothetical protein
VCDSTTEFWNACVDASVLSLATPTVRKVHWF